MSKATTANSLPLTSAWRGIWYTALPGEVPPDGIDFVRAGGWRPWQVIPASADVDPVKSAERLVALAARIGGDFYLLIPGRRFDAAGTRHGRGGGWYDRFLEHVPRSWVRVGICAADQWSERLLVRQPWDQPMDWIVRMMPDGRTEVVSAAD